MRALTIKQPWAGAIAHQTKRVENRTWKLPAKHHGARILIHAGAERDRWAVVHGDHLDVYSAIVAVATLTGCHWAESDRLCSPWSQDDAYHWTLDDVIALPQPVPAKGRLGLWAPDAELITAVEQQLQAVTR
ncbi:MAG TPA: hypothetical protein VK698_39555 [Kofleriaceae bacterium]|nr:hypothetical protein [Kofleriaceae bacterium]